MTPRQRIQVQLMELDDEAVSVVDRVVSALLIVQRVRLGIPGALSDGEAMSYPDFELEAAIDSTIEATSFHEDHHQDLPTTPKIRLEPVSVPSAPAKVSFQSGDDVEVALPDPIGTRPGVFIGVEPSTGFYRVSLGGGISKAFPPKDVTRRYKR